MRGRSSFYRFFQLVLLGAVALGAGCAAVDKLAKLRRPEVRVQGVRVTGLSFSDIALAFDINIKNPNSFGASLAGFDYALFINNNAFLQGEQVSQLSIPASGENSLELPLRIHFRQLYDSFASLAEQDSSVYRADFGLKFNLPVFGPVRVPVSTSGTLPLLKWPRIAVGALRLQELSFSGADLELHLGIDNPNSFSLHIMKLAYDFAINGEKWVSGTTSEAVEIGEKGQRTVAIPIRLSFLGAGRALYDLIRGQSALHYTLSGMVDFKTSVPLIEQARLPLDAAGKLRLLQ